MNREEYIRELTGYLRRLSKEDRTDALRFYEELFDDANVSAKDEVPGSFSSPKNAAFDILTDYNLKPNEKDGDKAKNNSNIFLIILLAIFAAPVGIPFAIALFLLVLGLCFAGFLILLIPVIVVAACIGILVSGILYTLPTYLFLAGLIVFGVGVMILIFELLQKIFIALGNWISNRFRKERRDENID